LTAIPPLNNETYVSKAVDDLTIVLNGFTFRSVNQNLTCLNQLINKLQTDIGSTAMY